MTKKEIKEALEMVEVGLLQNKAYLNQLDINPEPGAKKRFERMIKKQEIIIKVLEEKLNSFEKVYICEAPALKGDFKPGDIVEVTPGSIMPVNNKPQLMWRELDSIPTDRVVLGWDECEKCTVQIKYDEEDDKYYAGSYYEHADGSRSYMYCYDACDITKWMPIPDAPEREY